MANLTNLNNKFLVQTGGNVGINTTSPEEKLHIAGSTLISNNEFYKVENSTQQLAHAPPRGVFGAAR